MSDDVARIPPASIASPSDHARKSEPNWKSPSFQNLSMPMK